jgi:hypothetical protein
MIILICYGKGVVFVEEYNHMASVALDLLHDDMDWSNAIEVTKYH